MCIGVCIQLFGLHTTIAHTYLHIICIYMYSSHSAIAVIHKDKIIWELKKESLSKSISKQKKKPVTKDFKIRADGYKSKYIKLKFILQPFGSTYGKRTSAILEVSVSELTYTDRLNLAIIVLTNKGRISCKHFCEQGNFVISDFIPHEVIQDSETEFITVQADAYITNKTADMFNDTACSAWISSV